MVYMGPDPCAKCEEMLQPFLDRELSEAEYTMAEAHLDECGVLPQALHVRGDAAALRAPGVVEEMPPELKQKLAALRTPL